MSVSCSGAEGPAPSPRYELVVFDFDGTLADSEAWAIAELKAAAPRFGLRAVNDAEIAMLRGRSSREIVAYLGVPFWKLPRIMTHMRERMARDTARIALFPAIPALLAALAAAGVRMAVVSSNSEENVRRILGADNAARIERYSCGASMFGKARRLRALMRRSGVRPEKTLCLGDETRDIEAAREAGADCGAVAWGYATAEVLARFEPTFLFASPADAGAAILGPDALPRTG